MKRVFAVVCAMLFVSGSDVGVAPAGVRSENCGLIDVPNTCSYAVSCRCVEGTCSTRQVPLQVRRFFVAGDGYEISTTWSPCFQEWTCVPSIGTTCLGTTDCKSGIIMLGEYTIETLTYDDPPVACEGDPVL